MKRHLLVISVILLLSFGAAAAQSPFDDGFGSDQSTFMNDTLWSDTTNRSNDPDKEKPEAKKLTIIRRTYEYSEQLAMALFMMGFVTIMMFTSQELNPR